MSVSTSDRFSSRLKTLDEAPEPFRSTLLQHLSPQHHICLMVWGPASKTIRSKSQATLLTVTNRNWIVVSEAQDKCMTASVCDFVNTLSVELTSILLLGRLSIDFAAEDGLQFAVIEFNTVMEQLYQEAIQLLLDGMDGISSEVLAEDKQENIQLHELPLKSRNAVLEFKPRSQNILSVLHWSATFRGSSRWIQHELTPEAVLALTQRELMLISEEKAWSWIRAGYTRKYGKIVTYFPLVRLESFCLTGNRHLCALGLKICSEHGGENRGVDFPRERETDVAAFMERAMRQKMALKHHTQ